MLGSTVLLLGLAVVVLGCTQAGPELPNPGPSAKPPQPGCVAAREPGALCILVLGDSIAEGVPVEGERVWWRQLRRQLEVALPERTIALDNWAISGSQVWVLESAARDQAEIGTYDMAIVIEGVNDEHVMAADAWRPRYEAAIETLEANGLTVIVTTPPPNYERGMFGTRYDAVATAVREVATRGRSLLDIAGRWHADGAQIAGAYYADVIHQAAAGQDLMARMARDVVLTTLGDDLAAQPVPFR